MPTVKLGRSRQIVIPKKLYDVLGLAPGDYLESNSIKTIAFWSPRRS
jgi:AbrB family looped-hinge helix DNA binding protein